MSIAARGGGGGKGQKFKANFASDYLKKNVKEVSNRGEPGSPSPTQSGRDTKRA
jgi:hypothetical protein